MRNFCFTKSIIISISILVGVAALFFYQGSTTRVYAEYDVDCVAEGVGEYMSRLMSGAGSLNKFTFISPVFNVGEPQAADLVSAVAANAGPSWDRLAGIGINAYNLIGQGMPNTVTQFVSIARAMPAIGARPIMITETGWYPHKEGSGNNTTPNRAALAAELASNKSQSNIMGLLVFDGFGTNPDTAFADQVMTTDQFGEVCSLAGSCNKVGVNSAAGMFSDADLNKAKALGLTLTLGIISEDVQDMANKINAATGRGISPILRIGSGDEKAASAGSFEDPAFYARFLTQLQPMVDTPNNTKIYVIAGPNEPNAEGWADPAGPLTCLRNNVAATSTGTITIAGRVRTSFPVGYPENTRIKTTSPYVKDVLITAYTGIPNPNLDRSLYPIPEKYNAQTCKQDGMLIGQSIVKQGETPWGGDPCNNPKGCPNIVKTDKSGYFEIKLQRGLGCPTRANPRATLFFMAGSGTPTENLIKMWDVSVNYSFIVPDIALDVKATMTLENGEYIITADGDKTAPPQSLFEYVDRKTMLSCVTPPKNDTVLAKLIDSMLVNKSPVYQVGLSFRDKTYTGKDPVTVPISDISDPAPQDIDPAKDNSFKGLYGQDASGRFTPTGIQENTLSYQLPLCSVVGCPIGGFTVQSYGHSSYEYDDIPDCSIYKDSSFTISKNTSDAAYRSSRVYGPWVNLASPNFEFDAKSSEGGMAYLSCITGDFYKRITSTEDRSNVVCLHEGKEIRLLDIKSPWYKDKIVNDVVKEARGQTDPDCAVGINATNCYKLPVEYFPYERARVCFLPPIGVPMKAATPSDSLDSDWRSIAMTQGVDPTAQKAKTLSVTDMDNPARSFSEAGYIANSGGITSPWGSVAATTPREVTLPDSSKFTIPSGEALMQEPIFGDVDANAVKSVITKHTFVTRTNGPIDLGKPQNLCVKANLEDEKVVAKPFNFWRQDTQKETHPYAAGYTFFTKRNTTNGIGTFLNVEVPNLIGIIFDIVTKFITGWSNQQRTDPAFNWADAQCAGTSRDIVTDQDCFWALRQTDGAFLDGKSCSCPLWSLNYDAGVSPTPRYTINDANGPEDCLNGNWQIPADLKYYQKSYTCDGVAKPSATEIINQTGVPVKNVGTTVLNFAANFRGPFDDQMLPMSGITSDAEATNQDDTGEAIGKMTVVGQDNTMQTDNYIYAVADDPKFRSLPPGKSLDAVFRPKLKALGKVPAIPSEVGSCGLADTDSYTIRGTEYVPNIPDYLQKILERAGYVYNVPAAALVAVLYSEGSFDRPYFDWSEASVMAGSVEGANFGGCDPEGRDGKGPFAFTCGIWGAKYENGLCEYDNLTPGTFAFAVQKDFPGRKPFRCNLLDQAYAAAAKIAEASKGTYPNDNKDAGGYTHDALCPIDGQCNICFGLPYGQGGGTCTNWTPSNSVSTSRGYLGACADNKLSGYRGVTQSCHAPFLDLTGPNACRETYQECGDFGIQGQCPSSTGSYVNSFFSVFSRYKNTTGGQIRP